MAWLHIGPDVASLFAVLPPYTAPSWQCCVNEYMLKRRAQSPKTDLEA